MLVNFIPVHIIMTLCLDSIDLVCACSQQTIWFSTGRLLSIIRIGRLVLIIHGLVLSHPINRVTVTTVIADWTIVNGSHSIVDTVCFRGMLITETVVSWTSILLILFLHFVFELEDLCEFELLPGTDVHLSLFNLKWKIIFLILI